MTSTSFAITEAGANRTTAIPLHGPFEGHQHQIKHTVWQVTQYILYGLIFMFGVTGNGLVVLTVLCVKKMQSVKNYFILNLAITDLVSLLVFLPVTLAGTYVSWPFGEFVCKYVFPISDVTISTSIFTMVGISFDRYRAIIHPMTKRLTVWQSKFALLSIWVFSYLIIGLPLTFALQIGPGYWVKTACILVWPNKNFEWAYYISRTILLYLVPFSAISVSYLKIGCNLQRNLRFIVRSLSGKARLNRVRKQRRLIRMFIMIFLAFALCLLPIQVFSLLSTFAPSIILNWEGSGIFSQIALLLVYANSVCNPIILGTMSKDFKQGFATFLPCHKLRSKHLVCNMLDDAHAQMNMIHLRDQFKLRRLKSSRNDHETPSSSDRDPERQSASDSSHFKPSSNNNINLLSFKMSAHNLAQDNDISP